MVYNNGVMSPISGVHIDNFRGLRDFHLEGARMFNLLVGPSEIGKTSVLEAIHLLSIASNIRNGLDMNRLRGAVIEDQHDAAFALASLFYKFRLSTITLGTTITGALGKVDVKVEFVPFMDDSEVSRKEPGVLGIQSGDLTKSDIFNALKRTVEFTGAVTGRGHNFLRLQESGNHTEPFVEEKPITHIGKTGPTSLSVDEGLFLLWNALFVRTPSLQDAAREATRHKKKQEVIDIVRKINPQISDFSPDGERRMPLVDIGLEKMVSSHILGDGARRVLGMLGNLCSKDYKVHLEDEIGVGIYFSSLPHFLRAVLQFAKQEGKQIFATTHSKDILLALKKVLAEDADLRDDVAVFSFMPSKRGNVRATPYLYEDIDRCIDSNIEIR